MKLTVVYLAALLGALCTVHCKPTDSNPEDIYGPLVEEDVQNDNNDYGDYDSETDNKGPDDDNTPVDDEKPELNTVGQDFTRSINDTIRLPCSISGTNFVRIWRKNDNILFQSAVGMAAKDNMKQLPDGSLQITRLQKEDAGTYQCAAFISKNNSPTINHNLTLNEPPQIELVAAKDNITTLKSGDTLSLNCKVSGVPKPNISWHKHGERLGTEGEHIVITNVKHHDAGTYRCLADNKIGEPAHGQIEIKIEFKPVVAIEKISVSSENNYDTELKCIVHSEPRAQVVWKKGGHNVVNNEHTQLSAEGHNHILLVKGLQEEDFGTYTCSATNSIGETKKSIKLVKTPAVLRFIKPPMESKDVVLTWEVQSKSPISEHELQYRKKGDGEWHPVKPEVSNAGDEIYTVKYALTGLNPGVYETRIRSKNNNGWSEYSEIMPFEGDKHVTSPPQEIDTHDNNKSVVPAEHQETEKQFKELPTGASEYSNGAISISSTMPLISIALITLLHFRQ